MMIRDDRHYRNIQSWVHNFEQALAQLQRNENEKVKNNPKLREMYMNEVQRKLDDLKEQVKEYETIAIHDPRTPIVLKLDEIDNLPLILIKARMAAKLSQKELADLAWLTEEQIRKYEDKDYEDASFLDVMAVVDALDIKIVSCDLLVPLDTLSRTPITKEEILSKSRQKVSAESNTV